ncbi:CYTH and CHAD domain-containing protein [Sphingomonas sp. PB2P12]|uniref:CYTH and CHAD domain-containing protein n=1 Tax=Sphingomonas sandaracina TaxID=3096157 RepID=UPI002FCB1E65
MSTGSTHTPSSALEHDEIELKLEIDPESMDRFAATEMLSGLTPKIIHQVSTYFDTPDQDLRAAGLSLRVRTAGGRHVQTIKAGGGAAAGLFARPEWEHDVAGLEPDIRLGSPIYALVGHETLAKIKPAFTVTITRRQWVIEHDGGTVELVADTGSITAIDRVTPISELELELKGGSPTAIFALANTLGEAIPLRLGVLTKAERGYRLIGPATLDAVNAERLELAADTTTAEAFAQIAGTCLRHFRLNETILRRGPDPEALHQTRVALRRLRSALSIFKQVVADDRFPHLASELKWLAGSLGPARDLDVLRARLGSAVNEKLIAAHADAYTAALDALDSQRTRDLMIALVEWTALGTWRVQPADPETVNAPVALFADAVIGALRRRMKRRGHDLDHLDDEARHRIRIIAKKLRYATGFFQSLYTRKPDRRRFKTFTRHLEALQDHLGILNDLATAPALMERFGLDQEASLPSAERQQILSDATEAYERLIAAKRFW